MANEPNYRLIAFDPGGTTGWATYSAFRIAIAPEEYEYLDEKWACGQLGPYEHHRDLYALMELQELMNTTIIGERFDFRGDDRSDINLMAREYIGVIKLFSQDKGVVVEWQWPFEGVGNSSFVQDRHVKNIGHWVPGHRHAMDAMRHLLYYMCVKLRRKDIIRGLGK